MSGFPDYSRSTLQQWIIRVVVFVGTCGLGDWIRELPANGSQRQASQVIMSLPEGALARFGSIAGQSANYSGRTLLAISPNGSSYASFQGGTVVVRDVATNRELNRFKTGNSRLAQRCLGMSYLSGETRLATVDESGSIGVWDVNNGSKTSTIAGRELSTLAARCSFSIDGGAAIVAYDSGDIDVIDLSGGKRIGGLNQGLADAASAVALSSNAKQLAWVGGDGAVHVCDVKSGNEILKVPSEAGIIKAMSFSPNNKTLAAAYRAGIGECTIVVFELATGKRISTHKGQLFGRDVFLSYVSSDVIGVTEGQSLVLWDISSEKKVRGLPLPDQLIESLAVASDGKLIGTSSRFGTIELWRVANGEAVVSPGEGKAPVVSVAFSPDGSVLLSGCRGNVSWIQAWRTADGQRLAQLGKGLRSVRGAEFTADGRTIVAASLESVCVIDFGTKEKLFEFELPGIGCAIDRIRNQFAIPSIPSGPVILWDIATRRKVGSFGSANEWISSVAFSTSGNVIAFVGTTSPDIAKGNGHVEVWDLQTRQRLQEIGGEGWGQGVVAISNNGGKVAAATADSKLRVWEVKKGNLLFVITSRPTESAKCLAWSPDGKLLAIGTRDGRVQLRNATTGEVQREFKGHVAEVNAVAFSPDGKLLASGSSDSTVVLWKVESQGSDE